MDIIQDLGDATEMTQGLNWDYVIDTQTWDYKFDNKPDVEE